MRAEVRRRASLIGWGALVAAGASVILLPPGWLAIGLAAVAVVGLAQDRRLGWMPSALLVALALPFGRGADVNPLTVAGLPVRPQDICVALALGAGLMQLRGRGRAILRAWEARSGAVAFVIATLVFLLVGVAAGLMGVFGDHATRDVLRDARWWGLYLAAPLAVAAGVSREQVLRGLLLGATVFAGLVILASVAPAFDGALKDGTLYYDVGTPRMQFGNSVFLVPAVAYAALRAARRPGWVAWTWTGMLFAAQVLSLTRTSILLSTGVVVLVLVWHVLARRPEVSPRVPLRSAAAAFLAVVVGFGAAVGLAEYSTYSAVLPSGVDSGAPRQDPFGRITFSDDQSDVTVIVKSVATGGRFATYLNAMRVIISSPVAGGGLGQLVEVAFAYNNARAYTRGWQPGVDNAYLTVALKAGAIGVASFAALLLLPLLAAIRHERRRLRAWYVPAWLVVLALTMTQSFAVSSYAPFGLALLAAVPFLERPHRLSPSASLRA